MSAPGPVAVESFASPVLRSESGMGYHFLPVPAESAARLVAGGSRRVVAVMNGVPVRRAVVTHEGAPVLLVGLPLLRTIGARMGDTVLVDATPDPDPDRIDLGDEFEAVLADDTEAAARFFSFTPGRQRSMAIYVTGAKRPETRLKRALDLAHKLRTNTLYGDAAAE
ncbi:MAG TPA: YdeI/OmpD-associated family protein [Rubricoccaceae bacterium]|jgi:hypothetical protein